MDVELVDLSQPWGMNLSPYPGGDAPRVWWKNTIGTHGFRQQEIKTDNHTGTHVDSLSHFVPEGRDVASYSLNGKWFGEGVVADISDEVGEYDIYKPEHITKNVEVNKGDILIIHTGYHKHFPHYGSDPDEIAYFYRHPGPDKEFRDWVCDMELNWIGIDAGSADHPLNSGSVQELQPREVEAFEAKHGKSIEEVFPPDTHRMMHKKPFEHDIIHAENVGGDIEEVLNERLAIGAFPWKFVDGEGCICRVVAFRGLV